MSSCQSLSRVTFAVGSCLKLIEKEAFSWCESLKEIEIPASVEVLCELCFHECESLSRVTFAAGSCLKRIENLAFSRCSSLKEIEIPASVEILCERCFGGDFGSSCKSLSRVTFATGSCL